MPVAKEIDSQEKLLKIDNIDRKIRVTKKKLESLMVKIAKTEKNITP